MENEQIITYLSYCFSEQRISRKFQRFIKNLKQKLVSNMFIQIKTSIAADAI